MTWGSANTPNLYASTGSPRPDTTPNTNPQENPEMLELFVNLQTWIADRKAQIDERGATAVEYALMVGLIAVAIIAAVSALGNKVKATFNTITNTLPA